MALHCCYTGIKCKAWFLYITAVVLRAVLEESEGKALHSYDVEPVVKQSVFLPGTVWHGGTSFFS